MADASLKFRLCQRAHSAAKRSWIEEARAVFERDVRAKKLLVVIVRLSEENSYLNGPLNRSGCALQFGTLGRRSCGPNPGLLEQSHESWVINRIPCRRLLGVGDQ